MGPDQILLAWVRLLTGPRMDDHQVVDDAVPVRVERGEVDAWIREPHGLDDEPIDRTVRVVHAGRAVRAVVRHRVRAREPGGDDGRIERQRAAGDLLVIRTDGTHRASGGIQAAVEVRTVVRRVRGGVGELDEQDEDARDAGRLGRGGGRRGWTPPEVGRPASRCGVRRRQLRPGAGRSLPTLDGGKVDQRDGRSDRKDDREKDRDPAHRARRDPTL